MPASSRAGMFRFAGGGWRLTCARRLVRALEGGLVSGKADVERTKIRMGGRGRMVGCLRGW